MQNKFAAKELTRVDFLLDKSRKQIILSFGKSEVQMNIDEMKAEFLSFAIEAYKTKLGVPGSKVAEYFEETGTLDFLLENYDLLHTLGKEQLIAEIERFLTKRVNK